MHTWELEEVPHILSYLYALLRENFTTSLSPVPSLHMGIENHLNFHFFIKGSKKQAIFQNYRTVLVYCNFKVKLLFFLFLQWENAECITMIFKPIEYSHRLWT